MDAKLTRRQQDIYAFLKSNNTAFEHPPTLSELCSAMQLSSRGSMHKQIQALIKAGLVEPMNNQKRGIRLIEQQDDQSEQAEENQLNMLGFIAAGQPIEAISTPESIEIPQWLCTTGQCYALTVKGDSMIDEGIFDGDIVVIEQRNTARNGEIVVALVDQGEATLKRIEQKPGEVVLHPANSNLSPMHFAPDQIQIQGVLVGQLRSYH